MQRDDVEISEREVCFSGFYQLDRLQLRHRQFAGGMGPVLSRELFVRRDAVCVLPYDPQRDFAPIRPTLQTDFFVAVAKDSPFKSIDDIVQESFLRLAEQTRGERIDNSQGYLYRTASNLLIDHIRQEARRKTDSVPHEALAEIEDDVAGLEAQAMAQQQRQALKQALAELPDKVRRALDLDAQMRALAQQPPRKRTGLAACGSPSSGP